MTRKLISGMCVEYGTVGSKTTMTYVDGSPCHVGDIVALYYRGIFRGNEVIVKSSDYKKGFVLGICDVSHGKLKLGVAGDWSIELVVKCDAVPTGRIVNGVAVIEQSQKRATPTNFNNFGSPSSGRVTEIKYELEQLESRRKMLLHELSVLEK